MAAKGTTKKGGGGRKHGSRKNTPCQQRYVNENRGAKTKERRAQKYANRFGVNVTIRIRDGLVIIRPTV